MQLTVQSTAIPLLRNYRSRATIESLQLTRLHKYQNYTTNHPGKRPLAMSMSTAPSTSAGAPIYAWHEHVEDLERYRPGGYHPVTLETTFQSGRYQVVHKLGYGSYSTVWLARDTRENRYVALKVLLAEDPSAASVEPSIRARLRASTPAPHPGCAHVQQPLDEFEVQGPNGTHAVLVNELLGPLAVDVKAAAEGEAFSARVARRLTRQLALGLAYVHRCGIVHGDLHSKNVATTLPALDGWPVEKLYATFYGEPERAPVMRLDGQPPGPGVPAYTIEPAYFWNLGKENLCDGAKILDFGEASLAAQAAEPRTSLHTPAPFRAPESMFNEPVGPPADIWAFGCTVFDLWCQGEHSGLLLGQSMGYGGSARDVDGALAAMVPLLGKLPERWWKEWKMRQAFFEEDGSVKQAWAASLNAEGGSLAARVADARGGTSEAEELSDEDREGLLALLQGCLEYEPGERTTAEEILRNEWLRKDSE